MTADIEYRTLTAAGSSGLGGNMREIAEKILTREQLLQIMEELRCQNKRIVFTNGCFDILHIGHITYLIEAKKRGDVLIVGVNSDSSVSQLKGPNRPLQHEAIRCQMLAALEAVDYVTIFEETIPNGIIGLIRPHVHVKGGDYDPEKMPETPLIRSYGGQVVIVPITEGHSTSKIIDEIVRRFDTGK